MPRFELKEIQRELSAGRIWPVYWLFGSERMKAREVLKLIRKAVLGSETTLLGGGFNEEILEGAEVSASEVMDVAQSLSLGGGVRFVVIRDAHLIKDSEELADLLGPASTLEGLGHCCVFVAKDLDGRKKFSKLLAEKAAVIACEEIPEAEREAWIGWLAKNKKIDLPAELGARLRGLDPWSLDSVDSELEKYSLALATDPAIAGEVVLGGALGESGADAFLNAFFGRDRSRAMAIVGTFADSPEESIPLLGLIGWNVRQLFVTVSDRQMNTRYARLSPFLAARFDQWSRRWSLEDVESLQAAIAELDFSLKQTPKEPLALWTEFVCRFTR